MKKRFSVPRLAVLLFLALGMALRLWYFLDARSLFIDEANLALNISELPFSGFFRPLLYDQYAPPLFMVLCKGAVSLLGNHEWALRLWPLTGGVALLLAFQYLNTKLEFAPAIHWFPVAMLALSPFLLRYATELKQYSTDGALALGILLLALRFRPEAMKHVHYWLWALAGAVSMWFSMPAVFLLSGVGFYYLYGFLRTGNRQGMVALIFAGAVWALSFIALYLSVLKAGVERPMLQNYHAEYFFPLRLWEAGAWQQLGSIFFGLLSPVLGFTAIGLATGVVLLLWGSYRMAVRKTGLFILIGMPVVTCLAASALHRFSLIPRVALFLMPLFLLIAAFGASEAWKSAGQYARLALLALLVLEAAPFVNSLNKLGKPTEIEGLKGVAETVNRAGKPGPVFIDLEAAPAYAYYSQWHAQKQRYRLKDAVILQWDSGLEGLLREQQQKGPGFWLLFSHLVSEEPREKMGRMRQTAEKVAREQVRIENTGAAGYWYAY